MMMIFPGGGYNQGSHFVHIIDWAKHTKKKESAWLMEKTLLQHFGWNKQLPALSNKTKKDSAKQWFAVSNEKLERFL